MAPPKTSAAFDLTISPLTPFKPDLYERAWTSAPHPRLPLIATAHAKGVTVFSLSTFDVHSTLTGAHTRSVRSLAWKPGPTGKQPCMIAGSFDATASLWRWQGAGIQPSGTSPASIEREIKSHRKQEEEDDDDDDETPSEKDDDWEFTLVLEGQNNEVKGVAFSPSGQYVATCSRDKTIWIWEDIGVSETDDEWETVAVLEEHDSDVKAVAWCPETDRKEGKGRYSSDCLATASYDNTVRIWREDGDGEWVCVSVLQGHEATVWGLQFEPKPRDGRYPRLMTFSADKTIRIWTLKEEANKGEGHAPAVAAGFRPGLGGIPNTMRTSMKEEWTCTKVLPQVHTREVYAASWSETSGLIASTGGDGTIAVYREQTVSAEAEASMELDGDAHPPEEVSSKVPEWKVVAQVANAHGPYEVNHIVWSKRFDAGAEVKGEDEMLVTTGDDGVVRPWAIE